MRFYPTRTSDFVHRKPAYKCRHLIRKMHRSRFSVCRPLPRTLSSSLALVTLEHTRPGNSKQTQHTRQSAYTKQHENRIYAATSHRRGSAKTNPSSNFYESRRNMMRQNHTNTNTIDTNTNATDGNNSNPTTDAHTPSKAFP